MKDIIKVTCKLSLFTAVFVTFLTGCAIQHSIKSGYYSIKHNVQGNYYLDNKKYDQGLSVFQKEAETKPDSAEAHFYLGRFHLALEHPEKALLHLKQAIRLAPEEADYHFWLGVAAAANKQGDLERRCYDQALQLEADHVHALTYLGHSQLDRAEYAEALKSYTRAIDLWPENPQALFNRGLILKHMKRTPEEKVAWKQYLYYYPSGPMARTATEYLNNLGEFNYRNHLIGKRTVTLEKIRFQHFTAVIWGGSEPSLDLIGEIMNNNPKVKLHIVAYQKNNKELAEKRAKSIKKYLIRNFPALESSRLKVSWFDVPEKIRRGKKVFQEDESVHFITATPDEKRADQRAKGKRKP